MYSYINYLFSVINKKSKIVEISLILISIFIVSIKEMIQTLLCLLQSRVNHLAENQDVTKIVAFWSKFVEVYSIVEIIMIKCIFSESSQNVLFRYHNGYDV